MRKDDIMCTYFTTKNDAPHNLIDEFCLILTVRGPYHRKDFKRKKYGGTGLISEKNRKLCMQNFKKKRKQPSGVIL